MRRGPHGLRERASRIRLPVGLGEIGKVPFGGGLIPKAGIAWAATFAVGLSLERLYRLGYGFTRAERQTAYEEAYEHGKQIAGMLLESFRQRRAV